MIFVLVLVYLVLVHGSIFSDVAGFLTGRFKDLKHLASAVWASVKHVISWAGGIFHNVGGAWSTLHGAFTVVIAGLEHVAEGAYSGIRFLTNTLVPKWARKAITDAISWAERNIKTVAHTAIKLANGVKTWAHSQITSLAGTFRKALRVVTSIVNAAKDWIAKRGRKLWDIVMHPAKMVTWILPSLITPLFRWIEQHLGTLALSIGRWLLSNIGKIALELERAIAKLL